MIRAKCNTYLNREISNRYITSKIFIVKQEAIASLFISYIDPDYNLVEGAIKQLEKYGYATHKMAWFSKKDEEKLGLTIPAEEAKGLLIQSDGAIVFFTKTSTDSGSFRRQALFAWNYCRDNGKFFIAVRKDDVDITDFKGLELFKLINYTAPSQVAKEINEYVSGHSTEAYTTSQSRTQKKTTRKSALGSGVPSEDVKEIQTVLRTLNFFSSPVDGIAGPATTKAIEKFQVLYRMPVTGEWDERTKKKAEEIIKSRGSKKESPAGETKQESDNRPEPKYWLLKVHGDNWRLENFKAEDDCYFNSYFNNDQPRDEYEDFKLVRTGDKGLAYDYSTKKAIVFSFDVTKPLHDNPIRGEIFSFRITDFFNTSVPLNDFISFIAVASELSGESLKKLFKLTKAEFEQIIKLVGNGSKEDDDDDDINIIKTSISLINSDSVENIKDELGFKSDINALASVIAYKEVKPPFAIGLFGNWGSGKSFFMNKLQKRIDYLSGKGGDEFCKKILPITFNSWHYSDSNLWASLITKIFEELEDYGKTNQKDAVDELFQNLNSTKELLEKTKDDKSKVDNQIDKLIDEKTDFDKDAKKQADELKVLSLAEMINIAMDSEGVNEEIRNLKTSYPSLKLKDDVKENIAELKDGADKFRKSVKIMYSFRKGKTWLMVLCTLMIGAAVYYLSINTGILKQLSVFIGIASVLISKAALMLRPVMSTVKAAYNELEKINVVVEKARAEGLAKFKQKKEELEKKQVKAENESDRLEKEIETLSRQQRQLQSEIDDIITGKKIIRFIESRVSDERYINSLGIISWIRKDFEQLDELLKQQVKAKKKKKKEIPKIAFELDRIILYIDDLDRCDETIVVKVLEAIHLLLAFPLFVVVVGVDPRWMHNALNKKYADFLTAPGEGKTNPKIIATNLEVTNGTGNTNGTLHPLLLQAATSFDYLEKIFQIPFVLKPIDPTGKSNLIKSQFAIKKKQEDEDHKKSIDDYKDDNDIAVSGSKPALSPQGTGFDTGSSTLTTNETGTLLIEQEGKNEQEQPLTPGNSSSPSKKEEVPEHDVEDEEEEDDEKNIAIETERLKISEDEVKFMGHISFLIGETPRTIKRYINIYRIIRTHSMFEFVDGNKQEHYEAAMIMLALITGYPDEAKNIIGSIESSNKEWTVNDFLNDYITKNPSSKALKKLDDEIKSGKKIPKAGNIKIAKFQKNLVLTRRFSFRNLN